MIKELKILVSGILGLSITFLGETAPFVQSIFYLVVIDIITGVICAKFYRNEDITTRRFLRKIKELGLFAVGLASFILANDAFLHIGLANEWMAKFFCSSYIFYEIFSILENLGDMDFPVAKDIKKYLKARLPKEYQSNEKFGENKNDK